jgi:tetratricopeptide (TPR) repeat protein
MTTRGWHTIMALLALLSAGPATAAGRGPNLEAMQKRYDQFAAAGNYAAALVEAQKLEAAIKSLSGTANNNFGTALTMEAEANWHLGRYREAESIYTQALPIKEQALGASHPSVARMLGNLGLIYLDEARYRDAEGVFRRSLAVFEHAPGEEADVATPSTTWRMPLKPKAAIPKRKICSSARFPSRNDSMAPLTRALPTRFTICLACTSPRAVIRTPKAY